MVHFQLYFKIIPPPQGAAAPWGRRRRRRKGYFFQNVFEHEPYLACPIFKIAIIFFCPQFHHLIRDASYHHMGWMVGGTGSGFDYSTP